MKNLSVFLTGFLVLFFASHSFASSVPIEVLVYHSDLNSNECDMSLTASAEVHILKNKATLVLIPCMTGAYQTGYVAYTMDSFKNVASVTVLTWEGYLSASNWLTEASYDPSTETISTFGKSRGIGDCGQMSLNKVIVDEYGYVTVKTVQISAQECLDNPDENALIGNWPIVFKQ